jgi:nucleoside diphosphate kinase
LINLDKLIALLELQKTGSASNPKYTCRSGDSIEFQNGTRTAKITVSGTTAQSSVSMPLAVRADSEGCLVSLDTVSGIFSGITVTVNKSTVSIVRKNVAGSTTRFENVSILNKSGDPLSRVLYLTEVMKEYEQYINPADRDAYLVLASKESVLGESYVPPELVDLTGLVTELGVDASIVNFDAPNTQMDKYAAYALVAMLLDMRAEEYLNIVAQSGYRTYTYQENLFEKYIKQEMDKDSSLTREEAEAIYSCHKDKDFFNELIEYMTEGPCIGIALHSPFSDRVSATEALNHLKIKYRRRYGIDKLHNVIHSSDCYQSALYEAETFFNDVTPD